jgi:hypothetical protein
VVADYFTEDEYRLVTGDRDSPYNAEAADIDRAQDEVIEHLETWARSAWRPRTHTMTKIVDDPSIVLPRIPFRSITSFTLDNEVVDPTTYVVRPSGVLRWTTTSLLTPSRIMWPAPLIASATAVITYEYGFDEPGWAVKRPCIDAAHTLLRTQKRDKGGKIPRNVSSYSTASTNFQFTRPGELPPLRDPWPWDEDASEAIRSLWEPRRPKRFVGLSV